jgi:predicted DNA-binding transcriptional regulator AlpA
MTVLSIELPENVLDALAEIVAVRVLERLDGARREDRWLDAKQAAHYLGLSVNALHKLSARRQLPAHQDGPGHKLYFLRSELDSWRSGGSAGAVSTGSLSRARLSANGSAPRPRGTSR